MVSFFTFSVEIGRSQLTKTTPGSLEYPNSLNVLSFNGDLGGIVKAVKNSPLGTSDAAPDAD